MVGASTCSSGALGGDRHERGRRPVAQAEARAAVPGGGAVVGQVALGAEPLLELRDQVVGADALAGQVLADVDHARRPRVDGEHRVEGRHAVGVGGRHGEPRADVVERARADPADALLHGPQRRQQLVAAAARRVAAARRGAVVERAPDAARPAGLRRPEQVVDRGALGAGRLGVDRMDVHQSPVISAGSCDLGALGGRRRDDLVHPDRRRLELGRAADRIGGVDREHVRVDLVGEVERHEAEAGPQRAVDVHRRLDRSAARRDAHDLALLDQQPVGVLRRQVERLAAVQRRVVAVRLGAGVVRLEPAAGGEAQRVLGVERLVRRLVLDDRERRQHALDRDRARAARGGSSSPDGRRRGTATGCRRAPPGGRSSCRGASATASAPRSTPVSASGCPSRGRAASRSRSGSTCRRAPRPAARAPCACAARGARSW